MPRPTSFDRVISLRTIGHSMPEIVDSCLQSKGDNNISYPTSSDCVCRPRDNDIPCPTSTNRMSKGYDVSRARRRPTMCDVQGLLKHATLDVARSCV